MDRLGGLVVIAPARRAGDPGSNPGPGENFSLKLLIIIIIIIIMDLEEIGINEDNWVDSAQDRGYWRALVNAALNLRVP